MISLWLMARKQKQRALGRKAEGNRTKGYGVLEKAQIGEDFEKLIEEYGKIRYGEQLCRL